MTVSNTEIHIVTLIFVILEGLMFSHQLVFYLQKPNEKKRKYYLGMIIPFAYAFYIMYNILWGIRQKVQAQGNIF